MNKNIIFGVDAGGSHITGGVIDLNKLQIVSGNIRDSYLFTALVRSRFVGAILSQFLKPNFLLLSTTILALVSTLLVFFSTSEIMAYIAIFIVGLGAGNLFPLVFSIAINKMPNRANEISGLLVMAIVGGAIILPIMGLLGTEVGVIGSLGMLIVCFSYVLIIPTFKNKFIIK